MDVQGRWRELITLPEEDVHLDEVVLLISAHATPELDVAAQLRRLDNLAVQLAEPTAEAACHLLFEAAGIQGDRLTYDDPRNSYLDQVLDRRLGIPISLSVLLIEVARRAGLVLEGVGMPGHFLVRDPAQPDWLIDTFSGGVRMGHEACEQLLRATAGPTAQLSPSMLAPTGPRAVIQRMLTNLDHSFRRRYDVRSLTWVTRLRLSVPGLGLSSRAELAAQLEELGYPGEAAHVYDELAAQPGLDASVADRLAARAVSARAVFN
jgi:regulator of sirC expression with transglutaminase-like and TPR domain